MPTSTTGARQQRAERTRSLIIDTAARAFAENGFDGVSLNDLILASGMSKGAFYFHFSNKEEVALAAFRAKQQELIARLGADAEPGASASDELRSALRRRARLISDDPTMHCVVRLGADLSVRSGPGSEYASFQALGVQSIADLIERGVRSGEFARVSIPSPRLGRSLPGSSESTHCRSWTRAVRTFGNEPRRFWP